MKNDIQDQISRNIDPPRPLPPPLGPPSPQGPHPEIPRESPPQEIPAKPERDLPMPVPERAHRSTWQLTLPRSMTLALGGMSLFFLEGCAAVKAIFEAGFTVGVLVVVTIVAVTGGIIALATRA